MTPAQVVRASGGTARLQDVPPNPGQVYIVKAVGTVRSGDLRFDAEYRFQDNRLVVVTLLPRQGSCNAVRQALGSKYGRPAPGNSYLPGMTRWASERENVRVTVQGYVTDCDVSYRPFRDENSAGL